MWESYLVIGIIVSGIALICLWWYEFEKDYNK